MSAPDSAELIQTLRQWIQKAESDLTMAAVALKLGKDCPTDSVCFHAQQCIEKYFKALLVLHLIDFPKTHDLNALARRMPQVLLPQLTEEQCRTITEYATVLRYPGDYLPITMIEARKTVAIARRVRADIRKRLPSVVKRSQSTRRKAKK